MHDMMELMKQAQAMQQKMQEMQAEIERMMVEGTSGGGSVKVTMSVKGDLKGIIIDPSLMVPEEKEILEDLIVAAISDARGKGERLVQERMANVTNGLQLPPGMKLF